MNARLARRLAALYPRAWRARYAEEFEVFLGAHPPGFRAVFNVVGWAMYERVSSPGEFNMDQRQRSLVLMAYAYLAAVAAGVNFYWTVADTPLATAMHGHSALFASWTLVRAGSFLALAAVAAAGLPVLAAMVRSVVATRRWDVAGRLAVPACAALVTLLWMAAAGMWAGGHWIPTPWDVTGDWTAPAGWPPLTARWMLSSVTFALLAAGLIASAISVAQAIRRSDLSKHRRLWFAAQSLALAGSVAVMALGVLAWGWFAEQHAASDFHARNGGLFSSTNFVSWGASCAVFLTATLIAVRGARAASGWGASSRDSCGL